MQNDWSPQDLQKAKQQCYNYIKDHVGDIPSIDEMIYVGVFGPNNFWEWNNYPKDSLCSEIYDVVCCRLKLHYGYQVSKHVQILNESGYVLKQDDIITDVVAEGEWLAIMG